MNLTITGLTRTVAAIAAATLIIAACGGGSSSSSSNRQRNSALCYDDEAARDEAIAVAETALADANAAAPTPVAPTMSDARIAANAAVADALIARDTALTARYAAQSVRDNLNLAYGRALWDDKILGDLNDAQDAFDIRWFEHADRVNEHAALVNELATLVAAEDAAVNPDDPVVLTQNQQDAQSALDAANLQVVCEVVVSSDPVSSTDETTAAAAATVDTDCPIEISYNADNKYITVLACEVVTRMAFKFGSQRSDGAGRRSSFLIGDDLNFDYKIYFGEQVVAQGNFSGNLFPVIITGVYQSAAPTATTPDPVSTDPVTPGPWVPMIMCTATITENGASFSCDRLIRTEFTAYLGSIYRTANWNGYGDTVFQRYENWPFGVRIYSDRVLVFDQLDEPGVYEFEVRADSSVIPEPTEWSGSFSPSVTPTFTISVVNPDYVYVEFYAACDEQAISASITVDGVEIPFAVGDWSANCGVWTEFEDGLPIGDYVGSVSVDNSSAVDYWLEGGPLEFSSTAVSNSSTSTAVSNSSTSTAVSQTQSTDASAIVLPSVEYQLPVESIVVEGTTQTNSGVPVIPVGVTSMVCASDCISTLFDNAGIDAFSIVISAGGESVVVTRASKEVRVPMARRAKLITAIALSADGATIAKLSSPLDQMSMKDLRMMTGMKDGSIKPSASTPMSSQNNWPYVLVGLMLISILAVLNARRKGAVTQG